MIVPAILGQEVAELVLRIFSGEEADQIPIASGTSALVFDWRQLQRWELPKTSCRTGVRYASAS